MMDHAFRKKMATRFGITLVCLLAARGCATELGDMVHDAHASPPAQPAAPTTATSPAPQYQQPLTAQDIAHALAQEQYAH